MRHVVIDIEANAGKSACCTTTVHTLHNVCLEKWSVSVKCEIISKIPFRCDYYKVKSSFEQNEIGLDLARGTLVSHGGQWLGPRKWSCHNPIDRRKHV